MNQDQGKILQRVETFTYATVYVKDYKLSNYYNQMGYFHERSEYKCSCESGRNLADVGSGEKAICSCNQGFESDGKNCKTICEGGFDTHDARLDDKDRI